MTTRPMKSLTLPVNGENVTYTFEPEDGSITTEKVEDGAITAPKINNSLWDKLLVNEEASGAVASFDDGAADVPVSSLKVALEPIQTGSGDPSPSNIRPIIAANGKNLFDETNATVYTRYIDATSWRYSADSASYAFPCSPNTQYTVTAFNTNLTIFRIGCLNETLDPSSTATYALTHVTRLTKASSITVTTDANTQYIVIQINGTLANNAQVQIERGSSASAYQPYQGIMVERTGKNLLNMNIASGTYSGLTITANDDGSILANGTPTADLSFTKATGAYAPMLHKGVTYTVKGTRLPVSNCFLQLIYNGVESGTTYSLVNNNGNDYTITMTEDATFNNVYFTFKNGQTFTNWSFCPQLVVGTDTSENIPYISNSYPMSLGREVYGGTVDLATGVLTVTHAYIDLGDLRWGMNTANNFFYCTGTSNPFLEQLITQRVVTGIRGAICEAYFDDTDFSSLANLKDGAFVFNSTRISSTKNSLMIKDTRYTDATNFKTAVNGVHFVAELATPTTINLTPTQVNTLLGYNNISSSGTVDVIYHADTKLYVDKMTNVDNNIIAPTEETFTATRNYTVNDLVIVADTLYKVTANIASGSAITPNSNVQQTTLSALIKALS